MVPFLGQRGQYFLGNERLEVGANYSERHKYVDIPWAVIASKAKQSQGIAFSLALLAMTIYLKSVHKCRNRLFLSFP
jgi:hypothetical protein